MINERQMVETIETMGSPVNKDLQTRFQTKRSLLRLHHSAQYCLMV